MIPQQYQPLDNDDNDNDNNNNNNSSSSSNTMTAGFTCSYGGKCNLQVNQETS